MNQSEKPDELAKSDKAAVRVKKLKDLVSYQDGSVVSQTLIDKQMGTVTLFICF